MFQIFVDSLKSQIDGVFAFIVHADTDEDFDGSYGLDVVLFWSDVSHVVDHAIFGFKFR